MSRHSDRSGKLQLSNNARPSIVLMVSPFTGSGAQQKDRSRPHWDRSKALSGWVASLCNRCTGPNR